MMLYPRQCIILETLRQNDCSARKLANDLSISTRTIIREIKDINEVLIEQKIGEIQIMNGYHLNITNSRKYFELIKTGNYVEISLIKRLILQKQITMDELVECLHVSKKGIKETIFQINTKYQSFLHIQILPGSGLHMDLFGTNIVNLLEEIVDEKHIDYQFPSEYQSYVQLYLSQSEQQRQKDACAILKNNYDISFYLAEKISKFNCLKCKECEIRHCLYQIAIQYEPLIKKDNKIFSEIIHHLFRNIFYQDLINQNLGGQLEKYIQKTPFVVDYVQEVQEYLNTIVPNYYFNEYYLLIYALCLFDVPNKLKRILLLTRQKSIGKINKLLLEQNLEDTEVVISESNVKGSFLMVINNGNSSDYNDYHEDLYCEGVFDFNTIEHVKKIISDKEWQKIFEEQLQDEHTIKILNNNKSYIDIIEEVLDKFSPQISCFEKQKVLEREKQGNNLIVGDFIIPHIMVQQSDPYRIFYARLSSPVEFNGRKINHILLIIVSNQLENKNRIFNYLYNKLRS